MASPRFYTQQPIGRPGGAQAAFAAIPPAALPPALPPATPAQRVAAAQANARTPGMTAFHPHPNYWAPPHLARTIEYSSQPFVAFPAPGDPAVNVLQYTVPNGYKGVIRWLAIVAVGGGFIDGVGNVIWRIQRNQSWVQGYELLTAQIGSWAQPNDSLIEVQENETYTVTVEVAAGSPVQSGSTGARFRGWLVALNNGSDPNQKSS